MAFAFACPHCESTLRTGKVIPVGKKVTCPKCGGAFAMSEELIVDEEMEPAPKKAPLQEEPEEEEVEEKPKKKVTAKAGGKKKKKKKRKSHGVVIGMIIGGALIFFTAFASLIYFMAFRTSLDVSVLAFAPNGVEEVVGLDIGEMANHEKLKPNIQKIVTTFTGLDYLKLKYGVLKDEDINKILLMANKGEADRVIAVRYNKPVDIDKLTAAMLGDKVTMGDKTVYRMKEAPKGLLYFPEPDLMIVIPDRPSKDDLVKRDIKKNAIPDTMMPTLKEIWSAAIFMTAPASGGVSGSANPFMKGKTAKIQTLVVRPGTESADIQFIFEMASEEEAKTIVGNRKLDDTEKTKGMQALNSPLIPISGDLKKVFSDFIETMTLAQSGKSAYITGRVSIDVVMRMLSNSGAMFGGSKPSGPAIPPPTGKPGGASGVGAGAGIAMPGQ